MVASAVERLGDGGAVEADDDGSEGVVMTLDVDGAAALAQPLTTTMTATINATDRLAG